MAKSGFASNLGGVFLMVCAVNFIGFMALIGGMTAAGKLSKDTMISMLQVFRGTHVVFAKSEADEFADLRKAQAKAKKKQHKEKGEGTLYHDALSAQAERFKLYKEETRLNLQRLKQEQSRLEEIRSLVEKGKNQADVSRSALQKAKEKEVKTRLHESTKRLQKTFANMDPGDIAVDIASLAQGGDEKEEYAAHLLSLLKPAQISEVFTELKPELRQRLIPLMENRYASIAPDEVVREWKNARPLVSPKQMVVYFRSMPSTQVMQVWRRLDRVTREDVLEMMAPMQPEGR